MTPFLRLLVSLLLATSSSSHALSNGGTAPIRQAVENYLQTQIQGLPGQASFKLGPISAAHSSEQCNRLDVAMASGARPWGKTHVNVRCITATGYKWSLYVPAQIQVLSRYLVSARPVSAGQALNESDLQFVQGDLAELPTGVLTDISQAVGRIMTTTLPTGRPLRTDMMRLPSLVQQGQSVKILSVGPGFQAANEGRALNNAALGQVAQVRLASGIVVSGLVRSDGIVDIKF